MKLYLSSYHVPVPDALLEMLPKAATECAVAIIPNAKDFKLPDERAQSIDELIYDLAKFGFKCEVIDLREYEIEEIEQLKQKFQAFDVVWAAGGNTFILRSELKRTGLDSCLRGLVESGVVYCGESAGAIVAGKTLAGTELADEPELADEVILEGLGLLDKIIVPHADSPDFVEYANLMRKTHDDDPQVIYLNDDQALVVNGDQQKIVSATG